MPVEINLNKTCTPNHQVATANPQEDSLNLLQEHINNHLHKDIIWANHKGIFHPNLLCTTLTQSGIILTQFLQLQPQLKLLMFSKPKILIIAITTIIMSITATIDREITPTDLIATMIPELSLLTCISQCKSDATHVVMRV